MSIALILDRVPVQVYDVVMYVMKDDGQYNTVQGLSTVSSYFGLDTLPWAYVTHAMLLTVPLLPCSENPTASDPLTARKLPPRLLAPRTASPWPNASSLQDAFCSWSEVGFAHLFVSSAGSPFIADLNSNKTLEWQLVWTLRISETWSQAPKPQWYNFLIDQNSIQSIPNFI